jgi:glycogen debranching enzyme
MKTSTSPTMGQNPYGSILEIAVRGDFADIFEVKAKRIVRRGKIISQWSTRKAELKTAYRNRDFFRDVTIAIRNNGSPAVYANGRLSFEVMLKPGDGWHACLLYSFADGRNRFEAPDECIERCRESSVGKRVLGWKRAVLKIRTSNEEVYRLFTQAVEDMAALRLPIRGTDHMNYVPAAGVPWFVALFGRDSLIASLQSALVYPEFATATLEVLGDYQATERDDHRDAEPGKIMHELRLGELAHFKAIPHTPYYGTADATLLYLIVLHTAWMATGDVDLLERHLPIAEKCLSWIDKYSDRDGDGFQEYATRSTEGYENQGWKDAGEALVNSDGSLVKGPKALCELQGYVCDAWQRMAAIFDHLAKPERADELRRKAKSLFAHFNKAFWDEEAGFYAFALDGDKKKVMSVASNPGLCLWSGIVPPERARRVVSRLLQADMRSGWGIRTLSAAHPAFNPFS